MPHISFSCIQGVKCLRFTVCDLLLRLSCIRKPAISRLGFIRLYLGHRFSLASDVAFAVQFLEGCDGVFRVELTEESSFRVGRIAHSGGNSPESRVPGFACDSHAPPRSICNRIFNPWLSQTKPKMPCLQKKSLLLD